MGAGTRDGGTWVRSVHGQEPGQCTAPDLLKRVERANREALAETIRQCRGCFAQARGKVRQALAAEGTAVH